MKPSGEESGLPSLHFSPPLCSLERPECLGTFEGYPRDCAFCFSHLLPLCAREQAMVPVRLQPPSPLLGLLVEGVTPEVAPGQDRNGRQCL